MVSDYLGFSGYIWQHFRVLSQSPHHPGTAAAWSCDRLWTPGGLHASASVTAVSPALRAQTSTQKELSQHFGLNNWISQHTSLFYSLEIGEYLVSKEGDWGKNYIVSTNIYSSWIPDLFVLESLWFSHNWILSLFTFLPRSSALYYLLTSCLFPLVLLLFFSRSWIPVCHLFKEV